MKKKMKKVIIVSTVGLIYDGITSVVKSCLEAMDRDGLELFVVSTIKSEPEIESELEALGCRIVSLPSRRTEPVKYFFALQAFIFKNKIDIIHAHGNSATLTIELLAGFLGGCKKRIAHSHNTRCEQVAADKLLRPIFKYLYTDSLACGVEAGKWLFGSQKFIVLKNGRKINKFLFSSEERKKIREQYSLGNKIAIGHVGGFFEQKNHTFLIEIFREILKINPDSMLFLIGDGPLRDKVRCISNDISENIVFTGTIDNVQSYLQALDGMILPSLFEGMPLVAIEWQINGLPCVLSSSITDECKLTDNIEFISLSCSPTIWADKILQMIRKNNREYSSLNSVKKIQEEGFDVQTSAEILRNIYLF